MSEIRREEYEQIGLLCLDKYAGLADLKAHPCRIAFLGSTKAKTNRGRKVFADCMKVAKRYAWTCDYDFIITVYEPNCTEFTDRQMELLILHEMLHIGVDIKDDGTADYYSRPHDLEDFRYLIDMEGIDWALPEWEQAAEEPEQLEGQMSLEDYEDQK